MFRFSILILFLTSPFFLISQDLIEKNDGTKIRGKAIEMQGGTSYKVTSSDGKQIKFVNVADIKNIEFGTQPTNLPHYETINQTSPTKETPKPSPTTHSEPAPSNKIQSNPNCNYTFPDFVLQPVLILNDLSIKSLEKVTVSIGTRVAGYAKAESFFAIPNIKSTVTQSLNSKPKFLFRYEGEEDPEKYISLIKLETNPRKNERQYILGTASAFKGTRTNSSTGIQLNLKKVCQGLFLFEPEITEPGEYCFGDPTSTKGSTKVYAFSITQGGETNPIIESNNHGTSLQSEKTTLSPPSTTSYEKTTLSNSMNEGCPYPLPDFVLQPVLFTKNTGKSLEKVIISIGTRATGYGKAESFFVIPNLTSKVTVDISEKPSFLFRYEGNEDPEKYISLIKLETNPRKNERQYILGTVSAFKGTRTNASSGLQLNIKKICAGLFLFEPDIVLPGEYCFGDPSTVSGASKVFAFTVTGNSSIINDNVNISSKSSSEEKPSIHQKHLEHREKIKDAFENLGKKIVEDKQKRELKKEEQREAKKIDETETSETKKTETVQENYTAPVIEKAIEPLPKKNDPVVVPKTSPTIETTSLPTSQNILKSEVSLTKPDNERSLKINSQTEELKEIIPPVQTANFVSTNNANKPLDINNMFNGFLYFDDFEKTQIPSTNYIKETPATLDRIQMSYNSLDVIGFKVIYGSGYTFYIKSNADLFSQLKLYKASYDFRNKKVVLNWIQRLEEGGQLPIYFDTHTMDIKRVDRDLFSVTIPSDLSQGYYFVKIANEEKIFPFQIQ